MKDIDFDDIPKKAISSKGCNIPLLAKSKERGGTTLEDHLFEAACAALTVADMSLLNVDRLMLRISCFVGGLFHDLGKAAAGFQAMVHYQEIDRWPKNNGGNRHEILSAALLYVNLIDRDKWKRHPVYLKATFLAIISHHKPYQRFNGSKVRSIPEEQFFGEFTFEKMYNELLCNKPSLEKVWFNLVNMIEKDNWGSLLFSDEWLPRKLILPEYNELMDVLKDANKYLMGYYKGDVYHSKIKEYYSEKDLSILASVRAFVITGDHLSSGSMFNIVPTPTIKNYQILDKKKKPRDFQKRIKEHKGSALLVAPTGSGKTEGALFWVATNQQNKIGFGKVFIVLPFTASINAMASRINKILNVKTGLVGISHAKAAEAFFSIIEEEVEEKKRSISDNKRDEKITKVIKQYEDNWVDITVKSDYNPQFSELLYTLGKGKKRVKYGKNKRIKRMNIAAAQLSALSREIFYPIKVTTPHQLLKGVLQGRGWETMITDYYGGCFVFDEIHAYEPHMVGLIFSLVKLLIEKFNAKVLLMSATFPSLLMNKIQEVMPNHFSNKISPDLVIDREIIELKRHKIKVIDKSLFEFIRSINIKSMSNSEKQVLIICNTIGTAQNVYNYLKDIFNDEELIIFHSRFKQGDRNKIEKKVVKHNDYKNLRVVVSTQVVEVSLNLDFDYGICEIAPLDALIQRMGRINRKDPKTPMYTNIWITKYEKPSTFVYLNKLMDYSYELLKKKSGTILKELDLVALVDDLYDEYGWKDDETAAFERAFHWNAISNFSKEIIPGSHRYWVDDVIDNNNQIEVLLEEDVKEYEKNRRDNFIGNRQLLIRVRFSKKRPLNTDNKKLPPILEKKYYQYDSVVGLEYLEK